MRESPARRIYGLFLILFVVGGCSTTASLPSTLSRDPVAKAAPTPQAISTEIAWRKSAQVPSTAMAHEQWNAPEKRDDPIQKTTFQAQPAPKVEFPPVPEVMLKEPPRLVDAPPPAPAYNKFGPRIHGPHHAVMPAPAAPNEWNPVTLPTYTIRPPDVLLIDSQKGLLSMKSVKGQYLVRPDGTIGLEGYGDLLIAGKTLAQTRAEVASVIHSRLDAKAVKLDDVIDGLTIDVLAYNSSVYYVITDGAGLGEQVYRLPVTGNETVLDAIANIKGLPLVACPKRIWVARKNPGHGGPDAMLPVDWKGITQHGVSTTNWQIMPGDRVYVQADPVRRFNNNLGKMLEPIERVLGATLLGGQTVNTIKNGTTVIR